EPSGQPFRDEDEDVTVGREDGGTATLTVRAEDLVAGVYELDVIAPPLRGVTARVQARAVPIVLADAGGQLEVSNPGATSVVLRVAQSLIGAERVFDVTGAQAPDTLAVDVPSWEGAQAEIDVQLERPQWNAFTDFAVTVFDSIGRQVHGAPINYAFGRQR